MRLILIFSHVIACPLLQVHPERAEYATVGDDGTLRIWDAVSRKQLRMKTLGGMSRAVAYSPDGKYIAIGYGGRVGGPTEAAGSNDGSYAVLRSTDLVVSHQARDAAAWISDIKFSPDGKVRGLLLYVSMQYTGYRSFGRMHWVSKMFVLILYARGCHALGL